MIKKLALSFFFLFLFFSIADSQFYNGHQMQFGKNRVQYNYFYWNYLRYEQFDTYFNESGKPLAEYTADYATTEIERLEEFFDYNLEHRIIFIIYNKLSDFRQSNIGLVTGKAETNIGGTIQIDKNKVFLYFEGDYKKFETQITAAICKVLLNEMIYGNAFKENVTNSTLINLPEWYIDGLIAYISKDWDFETENRVKDGILSKKYKKFNRLIGEDASFAGHSFWKYVIDTYGETTVPSILYLTKINKNANSGFFYVVGSSLKNLSASWYEYYYDLYSQQESKGALPAKAPVKKRPKKRRVYMQAKGSPGGDYICYTTNYMGKYKLWLYNTKTQKHKKILSKEHKLEQITDYSYPVVVWHPSGRILSFIIEEKGGISIYYYNLEEKTLISRNILYFEKILDYAFSDDGTLMVFSAVKEGQTDIYIHNIAAGTNFQVTNDIADDFNPKFINNSKNIIFASTRENDSITDSNKKGGYTQDLFIYNYETKDSKLKRLSDNKYVKKSHPYEIKNNQFISLSDKNGIINRYISKFDSTISSVDTAIHYDYFALTDQESQYNRNIIEQDYNKKSNLLNEIIFKKGRYYIYSDQYNPQPLADSDTFITEFRKKETKKLERLDSLSKIEVITIPLDSIKNDVIITKTDTIPVKSSSIDINNYIFEIERIKMLNEQLKKQNLNITVVDEDINKPKKTLIYEKAFYQNYVVTQIDFSFLNEFYQTFTGSEVYFNPGTNLLLQVGTQDLFEDYKITAGYRLPLDFESSEFLVSLEDLKKRVNKQYLFHRQTFSSYDSDDYDYMIKNITNQLSAVFRYPFSQVTAVALTFSLRNDKTLYLPITEDALSLETSDKLWASIKGEYIFDNTRSLGLNLPAGLRFKIFGEAYQQTNKNFNNLFVVGCDFRHYTVLHRNLIWANRFAASGSMGSSKLIYYLGGVDNWTNFSSTTPTFIPLSEIRLTSGVDYAFQTVATNLRGFSQNIRNGSNFALFNSEIRWPIIQYIMNYPLSNAFLENFQIAGFFDIGSAWSGLSPWDHSNGYDTDYITRGYVEVEIDANRSPIVAGYGFGFRSQLLGYFMRFDWAWGIEEMQVLPRVFYFSLALDF